MSGPGGYVAPDTRLLKPGAVAPVFSRNVPRGLKDMTLRPALGGVGISQASRLTITTGRWEG